MKKVNLNVIRPWIAKKIIELVGFEDEVVVEYAMGLLEDVQNPVCSLHNRQLPAHLWTRTRHLIRRRCK